MASHLLEPKSNGIGNDRASMAGWDKEEPLGNGIQNIMFLLHMSQIKPTFWICATAKLVLCKKYSWIVSIIQNLPR
jgi:hypothetical protein